MQNDQKSLDMFQRLSLMSMVLGPSVLTSVDKVLEYAKKYGDEKFEIGTFSTWVVLIPVGAKNIKLDAVLAIEMTTESVFIDEEGMFGPKKTAQEAYAKYKQNQTDRAWDDDGDGGMAN